MIIEFVFGIIAELAATIVASRIRFGFAFAVLLIGTICCFVFGQPLWGMVMIIIDVMTLILYFVGKALDDHPL